MKIFFLILFISLYQYAVAYAYTMHPTSYDGIIPVDDMKLNSDPNYIHPNKIPTIKIEDFKRGMIRSMDNFEAEWLKRDNLRSINRIDPNSKQIPKIEALSAETFKEQLLEGLEKLEASEFIKILKRDKFVDDKGNFDMEKLKKKPMAGIRLGNQDYGFKPNERLDLEELKKRLTELQYHSTQFSGYEKPNTGQYADHFEEGKYNCIACNTKLFSSKHKYKSTKGYAAFNHAIGDIHELNIGNKIKEAKCENCGAHLGDIIKDYSENFSGKSYLVNSSSVDFIWGIEYVD